MSGKSLPCSLCQKAINKAKDPYFSHSSDTYCKKLLCILCLHKNYLNQQEQFKKHKTNKKNQPKKSFPELDQGQDFKAKMFCCNKQYAGMLPKLRQFIRQNCCIDGGNCQQMKKGSSHYYRFEDSLTVGKQCYSDLLNSKILHPNTMSNRQILILKYLNQRSLKECISCRSKLINIVLDSQQQINSSLCINCIGKKGNIFENHKDEHNLNKHQKYNQNSQSKSKEQNKNKFLQAQTQQTNYPYNNQKNQYNDSKNVKVNKGFPLQSDSNNYCFQRYKQSLKSNSLVIQSTQFQIKSFSTNQQLSFIGQSKIYVQGSIHKPNDSNHINTLQQQQQEKRDKIQSSSVDFELKLSVQIIDYTQLQGQSGSEVAKNNKKFIQSTANSLVQKIKKSQQHQYQMAQSLYCFLLSNDYQRHIGLKQQDFKEGMKSNMQNEQTNAFEAQMQKCSYCGELKYCFNLRPMCQLCLVKYLMDSNGDDFGKELDEGKNCNKDSEIKRENQQYKQSKQMPISKPISQTYTGSKIQRSFQNSHVTLPSQASNANTRRK